MNISYEVSAFNPTINVNGKKVYWSEKNIPIDYQLNTGALPGATLQAGMDAWSGFTPEPSIMYLYQGITSDSTYVTENSTNTIIALDNGAPYGKSFLCNTPSSTSMKLGFTTVWSSPTTGEIKDTSMVICMNNFEWDSALLDWVILPINWNMETGVPAPDQIDLQSVVAHEAGHMLGLNHSSNDLYEDNSLYRDATMYYATFLGLSHQRDLNEDDVNGLRSIYGANIIYKPICAILCKSENPCNDLDCDGLGEKGEILFLTNANDADTDDDLLTDGEEAYITTTDPTNPDTDADGLKDGEESKYYNCDPNLKDTDADGLDDLTEVTHALKCNDPLDALKDYDGDGLTNAEEISYGTLIINADSDGDGIEDLDEINNDLDPMDASDAGLDSDNDGLSNLIEISIGSNINDADTDDDFLLDGDELNNHNTSPIYSDTDGDGLLDGEEVKTHGTNPLKADGDDDCWDDAFEVKNVLYGYDAKKSQNIDFAFEPTSLDFGKINRRGEVLPFTIKNTGSLPFFVSLNKEEMGKGFSIWKIPPTLYPNGEIRVPVIFHPFSVEEITGKIALQLNECAKSVVEIPIKAQGLIANLEVDVADIDFSKVAVFGHAKQLITLKNSVSNTPLKVALSNTTNAFWPSPGYLVEVPPDGEKKIWVNFKPYRFGEITDELVIRSFMASNQQEIKITLKGFGEGAMPDISFSPNELFFSESETNLQEITVVNTGKGDLYIDKIGVEDDNEQAILLPDEIESAPFVPSHGSLHVPADSTKKIFVKFNSQTNESKKGKLILYHNDVTRNNKSEISLSGEN